MKTFSKTVQMALGCLILGSTAHAGLSLESPATQVRLVELFSSEGCSSCPPADAWLASLRGHPQLWKSFVPVEFHVDYWNRLGWVDRYSKEAFTSRQQRYAWEWGTGNVYTPGFVLSGAEWRPTNVEPLASTGPARVGVLTAKETAPNTFYVTFKPALPAAEFRVTGALLGNGLESDVRSGENAGRKLRHEFVVLELAQSKMERTSAGYSAVIKLAPTATASRAPSRSVAFWVTRDSSNKPVQAVGGDL